MMIRLCIRQAKGLLLVHAMEWHVVVVAVLHPVRLVPRATEQLVAVVTVSGTQI